MITVTNNAEQIARLNAHVDELMREIERLRNAKRRALQLADERAMEADRLRAQLAAHAARGLPRGHPPIASVSRSGAPAISPVASQRRMK